MTLDRHRAASGPQKWMGVDQPTYRQQRRVLKGGPFRYPAKVQLRIEFVPGEPFGVGNEPGRTALVGGVKLAWNPNSGRMRFSSTGEPVPLTATADSREPAELHGNVLQVARTCRDHTEATDFVEAYVAWAPAVLHLRVVPPVICNKVGGTIGGVPFEYIYPEIEGGIEASDAETRTRTLTDSLNTLAALVRDEPGHRRIRTAAHYLHVAGRLLELPDSPWEFLPEALLNLAKTLVVLFGTEDVEEMRDILSRIGYGPGAIEGLVSVYYIRSKLDVAHPRLHSDLDVEIATPLYGFLLAKVDSYRRLLVRVMQRVDDGTFELPPDDERRSLRRDIDEITAKLREARAPGYDIKPPPLDPGTAGGKRILRRVVREDE